MTPRTKAARAEAEAVIQRWNDQLAVADDPGRAMGHR
jgi:hypothetical protein